MYFGRAEMKPTNPMAQLQQWKANHQQGKINQFVNEMNQTNLGAVKNCETDRQFAKVQKANLHSDQKTQQEAQSGEKRKYQGKLSFNPLSFEYAQLSRQFKLIHDSNRKCLEVYPDDFHHKLKMREECVDLVERLKGGGTLFNELAKAADLTEKQTALLKSFNQLNGYLIFRFSEVAKQIEQLNLEHIELQKTTDGNGE